MDIDISKGELTELYVDLGKASAKIVPAVVAAVEASGRSLEAQWRSNAQQTSGVHGKHYPDSIDHEMHIGFGSIAVEVGPNPSKPQGGMSFELGSRNQPPHLDGAQATDVEEPQFMARLAKAADGALRG